MDINIDLNYLGKLNIILTKVRFSGTTIGGVKCCIAGGAIRDMLLNKPVSDIDVFYEGELKLTTLKVYFKLVEETDNGPYPDGFEVTHKVFLDSMPVPIQLIKVKNLEEHIASFPSKLIRVSYFSKEGLQGLNDEFIDCALNKAFWWDMPVDLKYFNKIKAKYSDWKHCFVDDSFNPEPKLKLEPAELDF